MSTKHPEYALFERFVEGLQKGNEFAIEALVSASPRLSRNYEVLRDRTLPVQLAASPPEAWNKPFNRFVLQVDLTQTLSCTVIFPPPFRSISDALAAGTSEIFEVRRIRAILSIVLDALNGSGADFLLAIRSRLGLLPKRIGFDVTWSDVCWNEGCITLSRKKGHGNVLMHDSYFFDSDGYRRHKDLVSLQGMSWAGRSDVVLWRGSSTGAPFDRHSMMKNIRIALTWHCNQRPDLYDVKLMKLVHVSPDHEREIRELLDARSLFAEPIPMATFARHKFALHIDGNASAAGFLEKMALGCCVLRVASRFEQWFEPRIRAWTHYVPIKEDLSDLDDTVEYLRVHSDLAETIARAGFAFAMEAGYPEERRRLARAMADAIDVEHRTCRLLAPGSADADARDTTGLDLWHALERRGPGKDVRWTSAEDITWDVEIGPTALCWLRLEIPVSNEIEAGFAIRSRVYVDGELAEDVCFEDGLMSTRIFLAQATVKQIKLVTPPLLRPSDLRASEDPRLLGLAIRTQ